LNTKKIYTIDIDMRFCEICGYYLFVRADATNLKHTCKKDGITIEMKPKTAEEALILETHFRTDLQNQKGKQSFMNEFTRSDPTMPHLHNVKCPNGDCQSNKPASDPSTPAKDIIYVKTDVKNLLFEYQCQICNKQWTT
jgi:DNA-directed RNA polymerase subunit M/transcription elongation factor TFIIS